MPNPNAHHTHAALAQTEAQIQQLQNRQNYLSQPTKVPNPIYRPGRPYNLDDNTTHPTIPGPALRDQGRVYGYGSGHYGMPLPPEQQANTAYSNEFIANNQKLVHLQRLRQQLAAQAASLQTQPNPAAPRVSAPRATAPPAVPHPGSYQRLEDGVQKWTTNTDNAIDRMGQHIPHGNVASRFLRNVVTSAGHVVTGLPTAALGLADAVGNLATTTGHEAAAMGDAGMYTVTGDQNYQRQEVLHELAQAEGLEKIKQFGLGAVGGTNGALFKTGRAINYLAHGNTKLGLATAQNVVSGIGHEWYTNPVGSALNLATFLDGGAALAGARVARLAETGTALRTAEASARAAGDFKGAEALSGQAARIEQRVHQLHSVLQKYHSVSTGGKVGQRVRTSAGQKLAATPGVSQALSAANTLNEKFAQSHLAQTVDKVTGAVGKAQDQAIIRNTLGGATKAAGTPVHTPAPPIPAHTVPTQPTVVPAHDPATTQVKPTGTYTAKVPDANSSWTSLLSGKLPDAPSTGAGAAMPGSPWGTAFLTDPQDSLVPMSAAGRGTPKETTPGSPGSYQTILTEQAKAKGGKTPPETPNTPPPTAGGGPSANTEKLHGELNTSHKDSVYQQRLDASEKSLATAGVKPGDVRSVMTGGTLNQDLIDKLNAVSNGRYFIHGITQGLGAFDDPIYGFGVSPNYTFHITGDPTVTGHIADALGKLTDQAGMLSVRKYAEGEPIAPDAKLTANVIFQLPNSISDADYEAISQELAENSQLKDRNGAPLFSGNTLINHPDGTHSFYANSYYSKLSPEDYIADVTDKKGIIDSIFSSILPKDDLPVMDTEKAVARPYTRDDQHPKDYLQQVVEGTHPDIATEPQSETEAIRQDVLRTTAQHLHDSMNEATQNPKEFIRKTGYRLNPPDDPPSQSGSGSPPPLVPLPPANPGKASPTTIDPTDHLLFVGNDLKKIANQPWSQFFGQ